MALIPISWVNYSTNNGRSYKQKYFMNENEAKDFIRWCNRVGYIADDGIRHGSIEVHI